jgi:MOSC domain
MSWTPAELDSRRAAWPAPPRETGRVMRVCARPDVDQRVFPGVVELSPERGAVGDRWERRTWLHLPDGRPDPRVQVAMMEHHTLEFLRDLTGCAHHPGDTFIVDFDLGADHLPVGSRVQVGTAVVEVTDVENDACAKFARRYGADVFEWIRGAADRPRRLRGLFARVVAGGRVRDGDLISLATVARQAVDS